MPTEVGICFACLPDYGAGRRESHRAFWSQSLRPGSPLLGKLYQDHFSISFQGANILFATALNAQEFDNWNITHLVMLHNDVVPEFGWIDLLVEEMQRTDADFLSVVLPIKDMHGLSSTGIDSLDDPFQIERRLTMTEVYRLPETFSNADCGYPDRALLVNTGCWIMDFTKPWLKLKNPDGTLALNNTSPDRIKRRPPNPAKAVGAQVVVRGNTGTVVEVNDGTATIKLASGTITTALLVDLELTGPALEAQHGRWEEQHSPADWYLSRYLHKVGAKVLATRKIKALHMGDMPYTNQTAWGEWETDHALGFKFDHMPIGGKQWPDKGETTNGTAAATESTAAAGDTTGQDAGLAARQPCVA